MLQATVTTWQQWPGASVHNIIEALGALGTTQLWVQRRVQECFCGYLQRLWDIRTLVNQILPFLDFQKRGDPLLQTLNLFLQKFNQFVLLACEVSLVFSEENKHGTIHGSYWKGDLSTLSLLKASLN